MPSVFRSDSRSINLGIRNMVLPSFVVGKSPQALKEIRYSDPRNLDAEGLFIPAPYSKSGSQLNRSEKRVWEIVS